MERSADSLIIEPKHATQGLALQHFHEFLLLLKIVNGYNTICLCEAISEMIKAPRWACIII